LNLGGGGLWNLAARQLEFFKSSQISPWLIGEEGAKPLPAKFRRGSALGVEKGWPMGTRSSRHIHGWAWEEEGVTGGEVPTATEAAAERSSPARGFPARRVAKLGPNSCRRRRRSYWDGQIRRRRGGGKGSTATGSHRRRVERRRQGSGEGLASGWGRRASAWCGEASQVVVRDNEVLGVGAPRRPEAHQRRRRRWRWCSGLWASEEQRRK
jgi:hypothetical protein